MPKKAERPKAVKEYKKRTNLEILQDLTKEYNDEIQRLDHKHPWVLPLTRAFAILMVILLIASLVSWALDIRTNRIAEAFAATALADYQANQDAKAKEIAAQAEAALKTEEAIIDKEAKDGAKAIYGIRNFIDKYGYSERDIRTYIRCMCDRVDFGGGVNDFNSIVAQEAQFLGYSENNPVLTEYYDIVREEIWTWHHETSKPWDVSYRFAELTPQGIYLTNEFGVDGYARRVRY